MSIPIKKAWEPLCKGQRVSDNKGNVWLVSDAILHSEKLPVLEIPMEHLNIDYKIGDMQIRDFVQHMKQILEVDLSYPIILDEHGSVLDGRHRIARALLDEVDVIKAKRFIDELTPSFTDKK